MRRQGTVRPVEHWLGQDGRTQKITIQGDLVIWQYLHPPSHAPKPATRGRVSSFSAAARLRMLKLIATIDWRDAMNGLFVTLTYPDDAMPKTNRASSIHLHTFHRHLEKYLSKKIPLIWRIEWEPRKSGQHKGILCPHFHLVVFTVRYIPYKEVNLWWKETIGAKGYVRTEVQAMASPKQCGYYVAKYAAKIGDDSSLVNASYLSKPGRRWGVLRKKLLPRQPQHTIRVAASEFLEGVRARANELLGRNPDEQLSLTLLGVRAKEIIELLKMGVYLTDHGE